MKDKMCGVADHSTPNRSSHVTNYKSYHTSRQARTRCHMGRINNHELRITVNVKTICVSSIRVSWKYCEQGRRNCHNDEKRKLEAPP